MSGEVIAEYCYDAWGNLISILDANGNPLTSGANYNIATANPFRYRGYYYDTETGFYYLNSRYYDPQVGRFINADGIIGANGDLVGYNMFAYCSNNPVMYFDPTGYLPSLQRLIMESDGGGGGGGSLYLFPTRKDTDTPEEVLDNIGHGNLYYKGVRIKWHTNGKVSSWAIGGVMHLNTNIAEDEEPEQEATIQHEYGHILQERFLGRAKYIKYIAVPSVINCIKGTEDYYSQPWEITADLLGGVTSRTYKGGAISAGWDYLNEAKYGKSSISISKGGGGVNRPIMVSK